MLKMLFSPAEQRSYPTCRSSSAYKETGATSKVTGRALNFSPFSCFHSLRRRERVGHIAVATFMDAMTSFIICRTSFVNAHAPVDMDTRRSAFCVPRSNLCARARSPAHCTSYASHIHTLLSLPSLLPCLIFSHGFLNLRHRAPLYGLQLARSLSQPTASVQRKRRSSILRSPPTTALFGASSSFLTSVICSCSA